MVWFAAANEMSLLAAAATAEALTRRHLTGRPLEDVQRTLAELIAKLLR
jgi:hypothetical protein